MPVSIGMSVIICLATILVAMAPEEINSVAGGPSEKTDAPARRCRAAVLIVIYVSNKTDREEGLSRWAVSFREKENGEENAQRTVRGTRAIKWIL